MAKTFLNCASCARFFKCKHPDRAAGFICDRYKGFEDIAEADDDKDMLSKFVIGDLSDNSAGDEEAEIDSLMSRMESAMSPKNAIAPDLRIDDRDLPQALNFWDFCHNPKFADQDPLPRQLVIASHLFGDYCPRCTNPIFHDIQTFPVDYNLRNIESDVTFLHHGVCPKCKARRSELVSNGELIDYYETAICAGQRSGKSIGTSLLNTYIIHRYIKLQNPVKVFKQTKNTHFSGTMVGLTFGRAKSLLYEPVYDLMSQSEWFREYHAMLEHYGDQYGEELFTFGKEMMIYKHRQLVIHPASPNKRSLRGDTRMLGSIDELGWFPYGDESDELERAGANEVYTALDRALGTIRLTYEERVSHGYDNLPNAYGVYVSSPSAYNDKIMSLVRTFEGSDTSLAAHFASWEMNPQITRKSKIIVKAYKENHVKAERDYGANPPLSDASYIEDISTVQHIFTKKRNVLGNYKYGTIKRGNGVRRTAQFKSLPKMNGPTVLAIDAGASNNSFGLAVGTLDFRDRPLVYGMMEIAPAFQKPLDYAAMYDNVILPICEAFNVAMLVSDRWNSMKILHDFEKDRNGKPYEVKTENVTLKKADFDFILDSMMSKDDSPRLPKLEMSFDEMMEASTRNYPHGFQFKPVSHMFFQMATVRATHKTVDKGQGYTDDVFRATMLLLNTLYTDDTQEWLHGLVKGKQKKVNSVIGVTASRGSTGGANTGRRVQETSTTFAAMGSRVNLGGGPSGKR